MLKLKILLLVVLLVGASSGAINADEESFVNAEETGTAGEISNNYCPVMGNIVNKDTPYRMQYNGKTIGFCCAGCIEKFEENPDRYLSNIRDTEASED